MILSLANKCKGLQESMSFWSRLKKASQETERNGVGITMGTEATAARFSRSDVMKFQFRADEHLVYSKVNRSTQILPSHVIELLDRCQTFKTLDEHARVQARQ